LPLHEGRASLWHLAEVLDRFQTHQHRKMDDALREAARTSMQANVARESRRVPAEHIRHFDDALVS
ncbi:MAG: DNA-binding protein, partial [Ectothiorhodospira sp.]